MSVSIITPVWNRADLTSAFLTTHYSYFQNRKDVELIIIDNGSTDNTSVALAYWKIKAGVKVIENEVNVGFGPANNQGAALATGDILIFMNNDVIVRGDYVTPIADCLSIYPDDLCGATLADWDTGWNKFNGEIIPYLEGWCVAMRKDVFAELGCFDERYKPGDYEDIDLSYTATQAGKQLHQLKLPLYHIFNQTARQLPDRRKMTLAHQKLFVEKWGLNGH